MARIKKNDIAQNGDIIYPDITIDEVGGGTDLKNIVSTKANIAQEAWITPTLLNGWVAFDEARTPMYMKDQFGFVHIRGMMKSGTVNLVAFALPVGYRPLITRTFPSVSNDSFGVVRILLDGSTLLTAGSNLSAYLDVISFKAEQ